MRAPSDRLTIRRILANNPGVFTGPGTNSYVVSEGSTTVVVDPGPIDSAHREAIEAEIGDRAVAAVLVTHTHSDHAPMANPLATGFGAPAVGYRIGPGFVPDRVVGEGDTIEVGAGRLSVLFTPGHSDDHLCFLAGSHLFTGDHIMGGSTVMVDDLSAYLRSLERLRNVTITKMYPGHGPEIDDPPAVIDHYISHRLEREREIVGAIRAGAWSVGAIVETVYADVDPALHPVAAYSVAAHLRKLVDDGLVTFDQHSAGELWNGLVALIRQE